MSMIKAFQQAYESRNGDAESEDPAEEGKERIPHEEANQRPFVEVDADDAAPVTEHYGQLREAQMAMGQLLLEFEQRKEELLDDYQTARSGLQKALHSLEEAYSIPHDDTYTFNMPEHGERGLFYRNDLDEDDKRQIQQDNSDSTGREEYMTIDTTNASS